MRFTVIGCGDAFGTAGRFNTCFMLESVNKRVLLDCGASSLVALKAQNVQPDTIDAICITHLHGDHFGGLVFLMREATLYRQRTRPLVIAGPKGVETRLWAAIEVFFPGGSVRPDMFELRFIELEAGDSQDIDGVTVTAFAADHESGAPSLSLRLTLANTIISYTGDTLWTDAIAPLADNADLLLCEAYSWDKPRGKHISYARLRAEIAQLRAKRILLTHLGPDMFEHLDAIDLPVARDGLVIDIPDGN